MARTALADHRAAGGQARHRSGIHPWYRVAHAGGNRARRRARVGMSGERRVVVTDTGAITPIGNGVEGLWDGLRRRQSMVRELSLFDASMFNTRVAGDIHDFDPNDHIEARR